MNEWNVLHNKSSNKKWFDKINDIEIIIRLSSFYFLFFIVIFTVWHNFFQALYVLCNLACHGEEICNHLVSSGVLQKVAPVLKSTDIEILNLGLSLVEMALRMTQNVSWYKTKNYKKGRAVENRRTYRTVGQKLTRSDLNFFASDRMSETIFQ
jgi:hypothetical protein